MPKKTVVEFKQIFAVVKKKPPRPNNVSAKEKGLIESDIDDKKVVEFRTHVEELFQKDEDYAVDLVAYKIGKHIDDNKLEYWTSQMQQAKGGETIVYEAVKKMIPCDLTDEATLKSYRKAQQQNNVPMLRLFDIRDPDGIVRLNAQDTSADVTKKIEDAFAKGDTDTLETLGQSFHTVLKVGDPLALARQNPKLFFEAVLKGFKETVANFTEAFANAKLRDDLKAEFPEEWKEFVATSPLLATIDKAEKTVTAKKKNNATDADRLDALFDAILDPEVMPLTYSATMNGYRTIDVLAGPTKSNADALVLSKQKTGAPGPATDCHNLQNLTMRLIEATVGKSVRRAVFPLTEEQREANEKPSPKGKAKGMVLTRPLNKIGTKGLIGSFQGNVFTESRGRTGKVFFTGDESGEDSHSWLVVSMVDRKDGKTKELAFDPVLGTKGDAVEEAIEEQSIKWVDKEKGVAKTPSGMYLIRDPNKDPGPNQVGISSYYTITKTKPEGI